MLAPHLNQPTLIHRTVARRGETENINPGALIWEFNCPHCGYSASYTKQSPTQSTLTVWNVGNPLARHHNSFASEEKEEMWLTPMLRQQMELLLQDINMD